MLTKRGWYKRDEELNIHDEIMNNCEGQLARGKCYFRLSIYWILIIDITSVTTSHCIFRFPHSQDSEHFQKYLIRADPRRF